MKKQTYIVAAATAMAAMTATFASAGNSAAKLKSAAEAGNAQLDDAQPDSETDMSEELMPVFEAAGIVQPVPQTTQPAEKAAKPVPAPTATTDATSLSSLVAGMDTSGQLSREMECLAGTVYFESRGEPLRGQLAVAQVVMNRAASQAFPSSYCGVVHQRAQFSFIRSGRMPHIRRTTQAWKRAKAIARIADNGLWASEAKDSLYFHARYVKPKWSRTKRARATIDTHIFYR